jgi:hypothetical protein
MSADNDRLDPRRDDDRDEHSFFECFTPTLKKIDRAILAAARTLFLSNSLIAFLLVGLVVTATLSAVPVPYGGDIFKMEGLAPERVAGAALGGAMGLLRNFLSKIVRRLFGQSRLETSYAT